MDAACDETPTEEKIEDEGSEEGMPILQSVVSLDTGSGHPLGMLSLTVKEEEVSMEEEGVDLVIEDGDDYGHFGFFPKIEEEIYDEIDADINLPPHDQEEEEEGERNSKEVGSFSQLNFIEDNCSDMKKNETEDTVECKAISQQVQQLVDTDQKQYEFKNDKKRSLHCCVSLWFDEWNEHTIDDISNILLLSCDSCRDLVMFLVSKHGIHLDTHSIQGKFPGFGVPEVEHSKSRLESWMRRSTAESRFSKVKMTHAQYLSCKILKEKKENHLYSRWKSSLSYKKTASPRPITYVCNICCHGSQSYSSFKEHSVWHVIKRSRSTLIGLKTSLASENDT